MLNSFDNKNNNNDIDIDKGIDSPSFGGKYAVNRSLYLTNLRRYWPGAALMLFTFFIIALVTFVSLASNPTYIYGYEYGLSPPNIQPEYISESMSLFTCIVAMLAGIVASMLCFRYLMNNREAIMMHSLPIRRESHLVTAAASGLTLLLAPIIIGGFLFYAVYAIFGLFFPTAALLWIWTHISVAVLSFGITSFFAMLTGNSIAHGILTLIFTNLPLIVESIILNYCERFFFGFISWGLYTKFINPYYYIITYFESVSVLYHTGSPPNYLPPLFFIIVGLLFLVLTTLIYKRRKIETAGDVISLRQVRPFFRYGAALGFAFIFGIIYYGAADNFRYSPGWEIFFSIIGGAFGFFVAEMFIRRTIHVFKRHYMGAIGFSLAFIAVFLFIYHDVPGYGSMKLDAEKVDYIVIGSISQRVDRAIRGEPFYYYGTIADLNIDDPGGYFESRRSGLTYNAPDPLPPDIAKQIIEKDTSVLRGEDAVAAVALQNHIAENSRRFSSDLPDYTNHIGATRSSYSYSYVNVIACYADGRIIERRYSLRVYNEDEDLPYETPESIFRSLQFEVNRINQAAERKYFVNCAAYADFAQLNFHVPFINKLSLSAGAGGELGELGELGEINESDMPAILAAKDVQEESKSIMLNRGEWVGLLEAFERDGAEQSAAGKLRANDYSGRYRAIDGLVFIDLKMPDGYSVSVYTTINDHNVEKWLIQHEFIEPDAIEKAIAEAQTNR